MGFNGRIEFLYIQLNYIHPNPSKPTHLTPLPIPKMPFTCFHNSITYINRAKPTFHSITFNIHKNNHHRAPPPIQQQSTMAPSKKASKKNHPLPNKVAGSLSFVRNFQDVYRQAVVSMEQTEALFHQVNAVAQEGKNFPVLLFSNEEEVRILGVLFEKYNYKGVVQVAHGVSKDKQRDLKRFARELELPLRE